MGVVLKAIFLSPPFVLARLGGSSTPVESFTLEEDPSRFGAGGTVIRPDISLEISDGHVPRPYLPSVVHFKDAEGIRPTCPFLEVWAVTDRDGTSAEEPLTLDLLAAIGISLENLSYEIRLANRKAARRTGDESCSYAAFTRCNAAEFGSVELMASSDTKPPGKPLVYSESPIPLGTLEVLRPVRAIEMGIDLSILRVRFVPAKGLVYGPPGAKFALDPDTKRLHEIVPEQHRILNPDAAWCSYDQDYARYDNPEPADTYDGADVDRNVSRNNPSWGVVDDTCDGILTARLQLAGMPYTAVARLSVGPPDFGPDRRFILSLADDFADRTGLPFDEPTTDDIADLFQRVFETLSIQNVDFTRDRAISDNATNAVVDARPPRTDSGTLTYVDQGYALKAPALVGEAVPNPPISPDAKPPPAPPAGAYTKAAAEVHAALTDAQALADFVRANADRIRKIIRPPWASFAELGPTPNETPENVRDPRRLRDQGFDMRMPPYMRDESAFALSLTRRQYEMLMRFVDGATATAGTLTTEKGLSEGPATRHLLRVVRRRREGDA